MQLTSPVIRNRNPIPTRYTHTGEEVSPPLEWSGVPEDCREFILMCEDPDAPVRPFKDHPIVHWMAYNIPPNVSALPEGIDTKERLELPVSLDQGKNSSGDIGYMGPNPPEGDRPHHYIFTLYALNAELGIHPGASKKEVLKAMEGHVMEEAKLIGLYQKPVH